LFKHIGTQRYQQKDYLLLASQYFFYYVIFLSPQTTSNMIYSMIPMVYTNPLGTNPKYQEIMSNHNSIQDHVAYWQLYPGLLNSSQLLGTIGTADRDGMKMKGEFTISQLIDYYSVFYWYADSLVGLPNFYQHVNHVRLVRHLLDNYVIGINYIELHYPNQYENLMEQLPDFEMISPLIQKFKYTECVMIGDCVPPKANPVSPSEDKNQNDKNKGKQQKQNTVNKKFTRKHKDL